MTAVSQCDALLQPLAPAAGAPAPAEGAEDPAGQAIWQRGDDDV